MVFYCRFLTKRKIRIHPTTSKRKIWIQTLPSTKICPTSLDICCKIGKTNIVTTNKRFSNHYTATLHNVYFVQYTYLATERAETCRRICILIYLLTDTSPSLFDCEVNTSFRIFVISNSKSGIFSLFLMPNNFGTRQKRLIF